MTLAAIVRAASAGARSDVGAERPLRANLAMLVPVFVYNETRPDWFK